MKRYAVTALLLWSILALELAGPSPVVRGALLIPAACAVILWFRNAAGILLAAASLLADWILNPLGLPITPAILPVIAGYWLKSNTDRIGMNTNRNMLRRIPAPVQLPLLTLTALCLHAIGVLDMTQLSGLRATSNTLLDELTPAALIAIPASGVLTLGLYLADEFGLRPSLQHHRF